MHTPTIASYNSLCSLCERPKNARCGTGSSLAIERLGAPLNLFARHSGHVSWRPTQIEQYRSVRRERCKFDGCRIRLHVARGEALTRCELNVGAIQAPFPLPSERIPTGESGIEERNPRRQRDRARLDVAQALRP
jgi:hypothetical protein